MKTRLTVLAWVFLAVATPTFAAEESTVALFSDPSRPGLLQAGIRWGELRVYGHDRPEVRVDWTADVEAGAAASPVELRLVENGNVMELQVETEIEGFYGVDVTIRVPRDTALGLEIRDGGNIDVRDVTGEIEVSNRNGSVELKGLAGAAVVHARNGSILARFDAIPEDMPMSFSTLNGSVDVTFPAAPEADVRIRYNRGGVESEFPIDAVSGDGVADTVGLDGRATRLLQGRIGGGGPRYYFHTANGTVYLRRAGS